MVAVCGGILFELIAAIVFDHDPPFGLDPELRLQEMAIGTGPWGFSFKLPFWVQNGPIKVIFEWSDP